MQLICVLGELMDGLDLDDARLAREIKIDARTIAKLRENKAGWRLTKQNLRRLRIFAFENGYPNGVFELRPHPMWATFASSRTRIFRGNHHIDADVEAHLRPFLRSLGHETDLVLKEHDEDHLREAVATENCIFVGSPKNNPASEIALALLYGACPFDASPANRDEVAVRFHGMQPQELCDQSASLHKSTKCGIEVAGQDGTFVEVDWLPSKEYLPFVGEGADAAAVIVCRRPMGTTKDVTTVIVAGYTARATLFAARQVTHGEPPLNVELFDRAGVPQAMLFRFLCRKRKAKTDQLSGLRREIEGTEGWGPPWDGLYRSG